MYVGRFIIVSPDTAAYRVSSRSFPNRRADKHDARVVVAPTDDAPETDNPYIAYNCYREVAGHAILGNGSHVDPVAEKLELGYPARDALVTALHALDFERDEYDTPRVAGVLTPDGAALVGTVRRDALLVRKVTEPTFVATYERATPEPFEFAATTAREAARTAYDLDFEHPVCAVGVARAGDGYETVVVNE
jgi:IMP cyclohydrolase